MANGGRGLREWLLKVKKIGQLIKKNVREIGKADGR